jgi:hypothetical protein
LRADTALLTVNLDHQNVSPNADRSQNGYRGRIMYGSYFYANTGGEWVSSASRRRCSARSNITATKARTR